VSRYKLIEAEKSSFPIQFMCRMLGVLRSGYYDWRGRPPSDRDRADAALTQRIGEIHRRSRQTYGSPRIHAELKALGSRCSGKRLERLMRKAGLQGCMRGRRKGATSRAKRVAPAEDLVKRNFAATEAEGVWVADITYVAPREGFLYLAFILEVHSRRIIGWAMESHLRTELVVDALREWLCVGGSPLSWPGAPFGPRSPVLHSALIVRKAQGGWHHPVDGKDRERPGQNAMAESFV
jgi:putative transposase